MDLLEEYQPMYLITIPIFHISEIKPTREHAEWTGTKVYLGMKR